jgi:hypothetical protein
MTHRPPMAIKTDLALEKDDRDRQSRGDDACVLEVPRFRPSTLIHEYVHPGPYRVPDVLVEHHRCTLRFLHVGSSGNTSVSHHRNGSCDPDWVETKLNDLGGLGVNREQQCAPLDTCYKYPCSWTTLSRWWLVGCQVNSCSVLARLAGMTR